MQNNKTNPEKSSGRSPLRRVATGLLRLAGWEVKPFPDVPRAIVVGGPHTSNWDGVLGITSGIALALHARFMIKNTLFKGPLGWVLRKLGGIPVNRSRAGGVVGQTVAELNRHDRIIIVMTPEGTRSSADKWKTGFHHIARQAGVPIVLAAADYGKKQLTFPLILQPSDDLEADMQRIYECFAEVTPRHPEKLSRPVKVLWDQKQATAPSGKS
ncbi:MAG: lysophospholipid acyltransferase family protein [Saccharospirillum sp.]